MGAQKRAEYWTAAERHQRAGVPIVPDSGDAGLLKQIEVDVVRTHPSGFSNLFSEPRMIAMLKRMLFTWSKENPEIGYYQGLNEIPTPLIVAFCGVGPGFDFGSLTDSELACVEADTYSCMCQVTDQLHAYSLAAMSRLHAEHMLARIERIVHWANRPLSDHLSRQGVRVVQYAFRWTLCLMLRELPLRDSLVVWDAMLSDPQGRGFADLMLYLCTAYLLQFTGILLTMNADSVMLFLHAPPFIWTESGIKSLIADAVKLRQKHQQYLAQREMLLKQVSSTSSPEPLLSDSSRVKPPSPHGERPAKPATQSPQATSPIPPPKAASGSPGSAPPETTSAPPSPGGPVRATTQPPTPSATPTQVSAVTATTTAAKPKRRHVRSKSISERRLSSKEKQRRSHQITAEAPESSASSTPRQAVPAAEGQATPPAEASSSAPVAAGFVKPHSPSRSPASRQYTRLYQDLMETYQWL